MDQRSADAPRRSDAHRALLTAAALLPATMVIAGAALEPDPRGHGTHEQLGLPACGARAWLGAPCPACGCTTAVVELWEGRPVAAFATQPFGFLVGAALPLLAVWVVWTHLRGGDAGRALSRLRAGRWMRALAVAALAAWMWKLTAPPA